MDAGELRPVADLAFARAIVEAYTPSTEEQRATRARVLDFIDAHPDEAHRRSCREGHLTASALALDRAAGRALLTHHRKLDRWLQLGGHCDGDANLRGVAWRETHEESGVLPLAIGAAPVDLDVHWIPARPDEPGHWHLDARYLIELPPGARPHASEESNELRWFAPEEARGPAFDASLRRLFELAF